MAFVLWQNYDGTDLNYYYALASAFSTSPIDGSLPS